MNDPTPLLPALIQRYLAGESVQILAKEQGVHRDTIYDWMLTELGDQYPHAVTKALVRKVELADLSLEAAADQIEQKSSDIVRVREKIRVAESRMRYARADLERRRPNLYGPKQEITGSPGLTIIVNRHGVLTRVKQIENQTTYPEETSPQSDTTTPSVSEPNENP